MSNVTLFSGSNVPAFAKAATGPSFTKTLAGSAGGKRISIKGGVFRLLDGGKQVAAIDERYLDVVIVNAAPNVSRTFYAKAYNPDEVLAPDCASVDGKVPMADVKSPQHTNCNDCPQNIAGSGTGDSRACRFNQRLAVVLASDIEGGEILQLQLPATSIFGKAQGDIMGLQAYARYLSSQNVEANMVITRMKFDTSVESPKLTFKPMRWLTEEEYAAATDAGQTTEAVDAITMTVAKTDGVSKTAIEGTPPVKKAAPAPTPAPEPEETEAPAVEDDEPPAPAPKKTRKAVEKVEAEEVDVPQPTRRTAAPTPAAAPAKSSLADIANDWDD